MGYRSDVAYTIRFQREEDYRLFVLEAKARPETAGAIDEAVCNDERWRIDFSVQDVKWYPSYPDVAWHEALFRQARDWATGDEHVSIKDGEPNVELGHYRIGYAFARIGEDDNDIESYHGGYAAYDWLYIRREIESGG